MKLQKNIFILFIALVYLMGQWGCATGRYGYTKPEPLLEEYRDQLGTIGVTTGKEVPVIELDTPPPVITSTAPGVLERIGQGAADGAEKTGGWMWDVCKEGWTAPVGGNPSMGHVIMGAGLTAWCILALPVGILGGIGGFFYGVLPSDESLAYPAADEVTLRYTVANYPIRMTFQSFFLKEARARTSHTFVVVPKEGSQTSEGLVGQGVDTVLELSAEKIWLKRVEDQEGVITPPMVLVLVVRANLVQATEKTVWYDHTFVHETERELYESWLYPITFQAGLEKAYQKLAEEIVQKRFIHNSSAATIDTTGFVSETHLIVQP